jgi:phosphoribosylanthranilate isomerase
VFVKICGITRLEDGQSAVRYGASALGFICWPDSPRFITADRVRAIVDVLPRSVMAVGVFVNQTASHINTVARLAGLSAVQLHGDETPAIAADIALPVIKSLPIDAGQADVPSADGWPADVLLLADARDPVRRGGTGVTIDWTAAARLAARRRLLLAGGLTPGNVADAIARVQPFGVDVSSGIEASPGIKDHQKLAALFEAIQRLRPCRAEDE